MIQYALKCVEGHDFDSWFQSAAAYDKLRAAGHVSCAVCGSTEVDKALMAPRVNQGEAAPLTGGPRHPAEQALAELKRRVETEADYVGQNFVSEARAMHDGTVPERAIWGEARVDEARALAEDGVPVAPLPFRPTRKSN
jgi:hypothetical protein